jgi:hypothetical protein
LSNSDVDADDDADVEAAACFNCVNVAAVMRWIVNADAFCRGDLCFTCNAKSPTSVIAVVAAVVIVVGESQNDAQMQRR